jgi:transcription antitermination protein NusB
VALGTRREARERALGLLYEADAKGQEAAEVLGDLLITAYSIDWALERMPVVDRTVLRMAIWELLARSDVPIGVVISEAVELAKRYSTDESGRFVNGVLASVAAEVRAGESSP